MQDPRTGLAQAFAAMADGELMERWCGGQLTEMAVEVARGELLKRGTPAPPYRPAETGDAPPEGDDGAREFVVIERSLAAADLEMLRARLQGEGIPALITDGETNRMNPFWSIALGGTRLLVPREFEEAARELIALLRSGAFELREDDELGT